MVNKVKCGRREGDGGQILWDLPDTMGEASGGFLGGDLYYLIYTSESSSRLTCGDETTGE